MEGRENINYIMNYVMWMMSLASFLFQVHYPVQYLLSEKPKRSPAKPLATSSSCSSSGSGSSSSVQEYDKALKDLKLQWMK